jgi:hypothetical protein
MDELQFHHSISLTAISCTTRLTRTTAAWQSPQFLQI